MKMTGKKETVSENDNHVWYCCICSHMYNYSLLLTQAKEKMAEIINEERYEEKGFSKLKVKKLKGRNKSAKL